VEAPATPPPTPLRTPSASPSVEPSPSGVAWEGWRRVLEIGEAGSTYDVAREVVYGAAGFLMLSEQFVGAEGGPRMTDRSMWQSEDGLTWTEVALPNELSESWIQSVFTTSAGEYVILLNVRTDSPYHTVVAAVRSRDGRAWERFETGLPGDLQISSVEQGAVGHLLVATDLVTGAPAAWLSPDGVTWELVRQLGEGDRWVTIQDAGAGDEGFVIVGTSTASGGASHEYFAHASADGRSWISVRSPFGQEDPDYRPDPHVAAVGPDWVVALPTRDQPIQFWASPNGLDWRPTGSIAGVGLEAFEPVFQSVEGRLYLSAVGGTFPYGTTGVWSSADGSTWEPLDLGVQARLGGIAAGAGGVVISGTEVLDRGSIGGVWVRQSD
jgi:hypothetical protein